MRPLLPSNDLLDMSLKCLLETDSFFTASNAELLGVLERCHISEIELASYAWCEIQRRGNNNRIVIADQICDARDIYPIPWLARARKYLDYLDAPPERNYTQSVYVILRTGYTADNGFGAYVGVTSKSPDARFQEHSTPGHKRAARGLPEHAVCLLTSLMHPYVKVPGRMRLQYETSTHLALKAAGVRVSGDKQADWSEWLPFFQPRLMGLLEAQDIDLD